MTRFRGKRGGSNQNGPRNPARKPKTFDQRLPTVAAPLVDDVEMEVEPTVPAPPLSDMRFADLASENLLNPLLLQTITNDLKFDQMTPVQAATLRDLLQRKDMLAQAKTGTGKTLAFLLPAIQTLLGSFGRSRGTSILVLTPTRELAIQIVKEGSLLLQRLPNYKIGLAIGGTNKDSEERKILAGCDILVATPGRLNDHLLSPNVRSMFGSLQTLVLDEADRLLDMGFTDAVTSIIKCLPNKVQSQRQGMLFSATLNPRVTQIAHLVLSDGYTFVSTIPKGENNTHERVPQLLITVPQFSDVAPALIGAIQAENAAAGSQFKALVFAPTAAQANWYGDILSKIPGLPPLSVLHSRFTQSRRTKITNDFRDSQNAIMVATDVVARGMDFPNVTNVIQAGIPMDRESYIHRLGRTARAGREGRGTFIVTQKEMFFPTKLLKGITFQPTQADLSSAEVVDALAQSYDDKGKAYQAWLGYYKGHMKAMQMTPAEVVAEANRYAIMALQCPEPPPIEKTTVGKMGLKGVPGLNVVANRPRDPRNFRR